MKRSHFNRLYYGLKPYLPKSLRMAIRRQVAWRVRRRSGQVWPILESASRPPAGWSGWPDGKRFAVVLTHDIEGARGVGKSRQLAELEMGFGLRSSFNFIPDGDHEVPASLRSWLVEHGFEVGVHDLNHDGWLYQSREEFRRKATQINRYLEDWGAVGFRSAFMHHNYEWLHDLDVEYDMSSFDTDPFEPQPDGVGTIFPFWIPTPPPYVRLDGTAYRNGASSRSASNPNPSTSPRGYAELPYTLPQDSTLFLLFREKTIDIWKRKIDWIVEKGGMVLVNVHPDYISFSGEARPNLEYSHERYQDLLEYLTRRYDGQFWSALPREVGRLVKERVPGTLEVPHSESERSILKTPFTPALRKTPSEAVLPVDAGLQGQFPELVGKRAVAVMFSTYPYDPRPRRSAEVLQEVGMDMDVICLSEDSTEAREEVVNRVRVRRVPMKRRRGGKVSYVTQYASFIALVAAVLAARTVSGRRYDLVHVHNMPDVLVFSSLVPRLFGARVILDLHDPMPELMMTIFGFGAQSRAVRLLEWLEKLSIGFASRVFTVNLACKKIFGRRSCPPEKIQVIMNSPDERIFGFRPPPVPSPSNPARNGSSRRFVIMCHGSIVERHGHDVAVEAIDRVRKSIPNVELRIFGRRTAFLDTVMADVKSRGLDEHVRYLGAMKLEEIVKAIDLSDVGIIPNRRNIFTELNTPTRIFEYLARGVPVIAPRAPGIQDYFGEDEIVFFDLGDAADLASRIEFVYRNPGKVEEIVRRGQAIYRSHQWQEERLRLLEVVDHLVGSRKTPPPPAGPLPAEAAPVSSVPDPVLQKP